jgi:DNA gyrase/topoisomerase IV subunit B
MASSMNKSISDAPNKDEETYQLLEQLDHILKRAETYIGSNKPCQEVRLLFLYFFYNDYLEEM